VAEGVPVLGVELAFGVEAEGALDVADLLERRTRLSLVPADLAAGSGRARVAAESCL
jgi:glycerol-3-phosphate dehydrogenase